MSRWAARWRVALRIAWRDAARHKGRTALVVAMVALPLLAGTAMITLIRSSMPTPATVVSSELGPSVQATVRLSDCAPMQQNADGTFTSCEGDAPPPGPIEAADLRSVLGVTRVAPIWEIGGDLVSDSAALTSWSLVEVDDAGVLPQLIAPVAGRLPGGAGEVAMSPATARRLAIEVGDTVTLAKGDESVEVPLVGLVDPRSRYDVVALSGTAPQDWRTADPSWLVLDDQPVTWQDVTAANQQGWEVLSRAVVLNPPPVSEIPVQVQPDSSLDLRTVGLVGAVAAMALLELALMVGPAFAIGAKRSSRQLAVAAAAGAAPSDLRRTVLATGVVAGGTAAVVGIGGGLAVGVTGFWISNWFTDYGLPALVLPTWELAVMAVVAVALGVGAAWLPARGAAHADVLAALAGRRGDPRPSRGIGPLGGAVAVLGLLVMLLGAVTQKPAVLVAGVVSLEVGVVMTSGAIVTAMGRSAPRLGVAGRFAVRDSVRHRSRTAPAVAAVLAAVAAAAAGGIYLQGQQAANRASWIEVAADPALVLTWNGEQLAGSSDAVADALNRVAAKVQTTAAVPVQAAAALADPETAEPVDPDALTLGSVYEIWVDAEIDPDLDCPIDPSDATDPRCVDWPSAGTSLSWPSGVLIDDGTLVTAAGLPGWQEAADVLGTGGAVVDSYRLWSDGTAHLRMTGKGSAADAVVVDAYGSSWFIPSYSVILSPEAAAQLGLQPVTVGGLITTASELPQSEVDRLNGAVRAEASVLTLTADRPRAEGVPIGLVLLAIAGVVALAAVGLAVGLAGADTAPDMATMAAIGAPPRVRRRIAAAQASVIAGSGAVLGVLTGIPIGLVLSLWGRKTSGYRELWPLSVPWPVPVMAVVIPLLAMGASWLCTRSRLPMVRRVAE